MRALSAKACRASAIAVVGSALALGGSACGGTSEGTQQGSKGTDGAKGTVAIMFPNASQPVVEKTLAYAKQEAAKRGYRFVVNDPGNDLGKQVGVIQTWISQGMDAIEAVAPESQPFENVAQNALSSNIPFVVYAGQIKNETASVYWPPKPGGFALGKYAAEWINNNLSGKAKVAFISFEEGKWARDRRVGMQAALKKYAPGAQVVALQNTLSTPEAASKVSTMLQAHPDLNVVLAVTDEGGQGAYQAFVNAGHSENDPHVFIGGMDGTPWAYQHVLNGTMYRASMGLNIEKIGKAVADVPINAVENDAHQADDYVSPFVLLTRDNPDEVKDFMAQWK